MAETRVDRRLSLLATDLDGTLIPLPDREDNRRDLDVLKDELSRHQVTLAYVTGRHLESAVEAMHQHELPEPEWIICDVGTSIYQHTGGGQTQLLEAYCAHQDEIVASSPRDDLQQSLDSIDGLRRQEPHKQGRFKLSYYTDASELEHIVKLINTKLQEQAASWEVTASVDPFNNDGLIDLLPSGISKSAALQWWVRYTERNLDEAVFAGDSGNDFSALTAGFRAILVGNADRQLAARVESHHQQQGWSDRLYLATGAATSGVLEGCQYFL